MRKSCLAIVTLLLCVGAVSAQMKSLGRFNRFEPTVNAGALSLFLPQEKIFVPNCAGTNDTAALTGLITLIGSNVGTIRLPYKASAARCAVNNLTIPANVTLDNSDGSGINVPTLGQMLTISGPFVSPPKQSFFGAGKIKLSPITTPSFLAAWWGEQTVTVPGPALAPTLSAQNNFGWGASFVDGTTYLVAYAYETWNGKTGLSPTTSFTAKSSQNIGVMGFASLADNSKYAVGYYVYISPDNGVTWHLANGAFQRPGLFSFGDVTTWGGGPVVANYTSGATKPVDGTTQTSQGGNTVSPPLVAPVITNLHANAAATYYGRFTYLCSDGTETAPSPASSGLVVAAAGNAIEFLLNEEPPSGAVAVRLYVGTSATASAMHLQVTQPLHYPRGQIQDYSTAGAAPSSGASQSAICNVQQAYDSMMESGAAGRILVGAGTTSLKSPLILRLKNSTATQVIGIQVEGTAGVAAPFNTTGSTLSYTGTQSTAVTAVVYSTTQLEYRNINQRDPNSRVSVGLGSCDFFGGGGFSSKWHNSLFEGMKSGGIGYQIPIEAVGAGGHGTSEQHFYECVFNGNAWGVDLHGGQVADIQLVNCETLSNGNSGSANSGQIRNASGFYGLHVRGWEGTGVAFVGYVFFITSDEPLPQGAQGCLSVRDAAFDAVAASATSFIHSSAVSPNATTISVSDSFFNSSLSDRFAFYAGGPANLTLNSVGGGGNGWVNWVNTTPYEIATEKVVIQENGQDSFFGLLGGTYSFKITSNTTASFTNNADKTKVYINNVLLSRTGTNSTTPTTLSANVNDYNPGGLTYYQRWSSDASRNVTGLTFSGLQVDGERHLITNIYLNDIVLKHQSGSSTAANRFYNSTGADITLTPKQSAEVIYDVTNQYWLVYKRN